MASPGFTSRRGWPPGAVGAALVGLQQAALTPQTCPHVLELLTVLHSADVQRPALRMPVLHCAAKVLRSSKAAPQAKAAAASIVGALCAQTCRSCSIGTQDQQTFPEVALPDPAVITALFECICIAPPASFLLAEATNALATVLRCTACQGPCSRSLQQHMCGHSAVPAILHGLRTALATTAPQPVCPPWLPPALEALSLLVSGMPSVVLADMVGDGWQLMKTAVVRCAKDPSVHSHVTVILSALFPAWTLPGVQAIRLDDSPALHADSLVLVANLAAANAAHGNLTTARTATWALASMAVHAARHPALADGSLPVAHQQQLWVMLTGQVMLIVMDMLANVAQQDHGLAKNCLRYIEVVAGACQRGGHSAAVAACGDGSATQFLRDALQLAASVAKLTTELRLQVAALRCMRTLLGHPHVFGLLSDDDTLAMLLRTTSLARFTPGCNPKDVALAQAYGVCVLGSVLTRDNLHTVHMTTAASVAPEAHASVAAAVGFLLEQLQASASGVMLPWQAEEVAHEPEGVVCRLASTCLSSHEEVNSGLIASMAAACAHVLHWCGVAGHAPLGVNCPDGSGITVLHRLAAAGLTDAVRAFVSAAGPALDLGLQDVSGLTAMDIARHRGHTGVVAVLADAAKAFRADATAGPLSPVTAALPHGPQAPHSGHSAQLLPSWLSAPSPQQANSEPLPRLITAASALDARCCPPLGLFSPGASAPGAAPAPLPSPQLLPASSEHTSLDEGSIGAPFMGDAGFRVNTAALSQLIGSVVAGRGNMPMNSLPAWLSAGVAAAVSAHEEAVANAVLNPEAAAQQLRAEDLALIADAEALLSSHRLGGGGSGGGATDIFDDGSSDCAGGGSRAVSKHLWLGNLSTKLPRSVLKAVFEHFGVVEDVVTFPGRMYAFVNFRNPEDAVRAAHSLNDREVPPLTGTRRLVVKFRPSKKALGKSADGPGADAAAAAAAGSSTPSADEDQSPSHGSKPPSRASLCGSDCIKAGDDQAVSSKAGEVVGVSGGDSSGSSGAGDANGGVSSSVPDSCNLHSSTGSDDEAQGGSCSLDGCGSDGVDRGVQASYDSRNGCNSNNSGGCNSNNLIASLAGLTSSAGDGDATNLGSSSPDSFTDADEAVFAEGRPSRHLWLGNIPLRPNKQAMEVLFSQYGSLESVRVFPGKTFAFVNFVDAADAMQAKAVLDGQMASSVTGLKPLAIRFQKDTPSSSPGPGQSSDSATPTAASQSDLNQAAKATLDTCQQAANVLSAAAAAASNNNHPTSTSPLGQLDTEPSSNSSMATANSMLLNAAVDRVVSGGSSVMRPAASMMMAPSSLMARNDSCNGSGPTSAAASLAGVLLAGRAGVPVLAGLAAATGLSKLLDEDVPQEPAINLSNRLNPNNVHFDKELAARYKRMTKAEKEALWAQDRMLQQMASSTAAAALLSAAQGVDGGTAALLAGAGLGASRQLAAMPPAAALAGLPSLTELTELHRLNQLLPRVMSSNTLTSIAAAAQLQQVAAVQNPAAAASGLGRGASIQAIPGLLGSSTSAAALLQAQLGLLGGGGPAVGTASAVAAMQAQLLQHHQQQQQQLVALGLGAMPPQHGLTAAQQLQQQLMGLGLNGGMGGKGMPPAAADQLMSSLAGPTAVHHLQQQLQLQQQQQQQQQHQMALLGSLQAQAAVARGQADLNALMQAQALAHLTAGVPPQHVGAGNGYMAHQQHAMPPATHNVPAPHSPLFPGGHDASAAQQLQQLIQLQQLQQQQEQQQLLQQEQQQLLQQQQKHFPTSFHCPLSGVLMTDPVVAADGVTYERAPIAEWLQQHNNSPITRHTLANKFLAPNHSLKAAVLNELARAGNMRLPHMA